MGVNKTVRTAIVALLLIASAVPAHAEPPEVLEEPIVLIVPDTTYDLAVFWNITRADFCAWEAGGFLGSAPLQELVEVMLKETGKGALVASFQATRVMELWHLDADADLSGPCEDTDDQAAPAAVGTAQVGMNDNDLFVSGTRTNAFGIRGQGRLVGDDGSRWNYSFTFRARIDRQGTFNAMVDRSNLVVVGP
jgi:hypothetical protein